ncbi:MAG TPA: ribokinase, partial [Microbacterium sp.]|nr:ribokinase [Microbacterium sp.]
AAGALAVTVRGASPSLPTRERVDAFLAERPAPEIVDGSRA